MALGIKYINLLYKKLKQKAYVNLNKGNFDKSLAYINAAAYTNYSFFLGLKDDELESYISQISKVIKKKPFVCKQERSCVFFDYFSLDNRGLTQQYLDALIANNYQFLYICRKDLNSPSSSDIYLTLNAYSKAKICRIPKNLSGIKEAQWIYDTICDYGANKLLMHLIPQAAVECVAFSALPDIITRFQINLTDHAFWLGKNCSDYTLEFRQHGANISFHNRGFNARQLLLLPYYPVMKESPFEGFPKQADGKIVFFSGGACYKVINEEGSFFILCRRILDKCKNAIILFATSGDDANVRSLISKYGMEDRFLLIGHRHDILEVFKHSDIYINTYPRGGGLMAQYAAHCSLPILNYLNDQIEEIVCQKKRVSFTSYSLEDFVTEAQKLYSDEVYRKERGRELRNCVMSLFEFNIGFKTAIEKNITPVDFVILPYVDSKMDEIGSIMYHNKTKEFHKTISQLFGWKSIYIIPNIFLQVLPFFVRVKIRKLINFCRVI